jgi:NTE family protein
MMGVERWKKNSADTDILIQPNLELFGIGDFESGKIPKIIESGDAAAHENLAALLSLKQRLNLAPMRNVSNLDQFQKRPLIHSVQITGYTTIPFQTLYQQIGVKPGDECRTDAIQKRLAEMRKSGAFESIHYDIIPISDDRVRLLVHVTEKQAPQIYGVRIDGNRVLSFTFIYQMLGLHPGDFLDTDDLSRRIMKMYGLGYFESIRYDVETIGDNRIRLFLHVKEFPRRKLKLGVRYNSLHKLVAVTGLESSNFPFAGMRMEHELQFAGLTQYKARVYYPSRTLNLPLYPLACLYYKKIPIPIYDGVGQKIASYNDHSLSLGAGLGLTLGDPMHLAVTYTSEIMDIEPNIAMPDPTVFPTWKDHLKQIRASFDFDTIDNILLPGDGLRLQILYEGSLKQLHTDRPYRALSVSGDAYHTFFNRHTLRIFGRYVAVTDNTPTYKLFYEEGPDQFVGLDYYQLAGRRFSVARLDYRYRVSPSIYVKWIGNAVFDLSYGYPDQSDYGVDRLWGTGAGVTVMSFLGPIDLILARGSKGLLETGKGENRVYFSFGCKF